MGIAISGIASGIDSDAIINQLLSIETSRIIGIQRKIALQQVRKDAFATLTNQLESLRNASRKLADSNLYSQVNASSSDAGVLTVSASNDAALGNYSVEVLQVATRHRVAAQGFVDKSGTGIAADAGTFSFRVGDGDAVEIDVDGSTSLQDLARAINDAGAGVRADIVNDGSSLNPFRLVLTAEQTGSDGLVTVVENDTTLDFENTSIESAVAADGNSADYGGTVSSGGAYTGTDNTTFIVEIITEGAADGTAKYRVSTDGGLTFDDNGGAGYDATSAGAIELADGVTIEFEDNGTLREGDTFSIDVFNPELATPQDAVINVNGINIRKSSNTIDDIFDGVTFKLQSASVGQTVNISVDRETGDISQAMSGLLGAYNGVIGFLNAQFAYDPESGQAAPPLNGDPTARQIARQVQQFMTGRIPGLGDDTISSLSELGFETNPETGVMSFNSAKLDEALRDDPDAVARVLSRFGERLSGDFEFVRRSADTRPGTYQVEITQARTRAEVVAGGAAEVLAADETITVRLNRRAQNDDGGVFVETTIDLAAGDTVAEQITKLNAGFEDASFAVTAYLDADGAIAIRSDAYGGDYAIEVSSDTAAGAGTSNIGDGLLEDQGTDLEGRIGNRPARTLEGDVLKGSEGYDTEDIELRIPNDTSGVLGEVRIADGVGQALPALIDNFTGVGGLLRSRTTSIDNRISSYEEDILAQERRAVQIEERLRRQFANLEVTLGRTQALGDYVTQQLALLPKISSSKK